VTKKQLKESSDRYKRCYDQVLNSLPLWRQNAVKEDVTAKKNSGLLTDFVRLVIEAAEREELADIERKTVRKKFSNTVSDKQPINKL
jgi:hypothetical protein